MKIPWHALSTEVRELLETSKCRGFLYKKKFAQMAECRWKFAVGIEQACEHFGY